MGNRLVEHKCLRCGADLFCDYMGNFDEYHCCSQCTEVVRKAVYEAKKPKKKGKKYGGSFLRHQHNLVYIVDVFKEPE